jgi:hypothetical protein
VHGTEPNDVAARVFALLDRAQMSFELKARVYDVVRGGRSPASKALELQGLELEPSVLGAVSEILLARV